MRSGETSGTRCGSTGPAIPRPPTLTSGDQEWIETETPVTLLGQKQVEGKGGEIVGEGIETGMFLAVEDLEVTAAGGTGFRLDRCFSTVETVISQVFFRGAVDASSTQAMPCSATQSTVDIAHPRRGNAGFDGAGEGEKATYRATVRRNGQWVQEPRMSLLPGCSDHPVYLQGGRDHSGEAGIDLLEFPGQKTACPGLEFVLTGRPTAPQEGDKGFRVSFHGQPKSCLRSGQKPARADLPKGLLPTRQQSPGDVERPSPGWIRSGEIRPGRASPCGGLPKPCKIGHETPLHLD